MTERKTPAVVLGAGINGLGVARSLARARVPVWLLDTNVRQPEMRTRTAKSLRIRALDGEILLEDLERLGREQFPARQRPVLFLTQEATVRTVSLYRDQLTPHYRFSLPPVDAVAALQHKYGFHQLAEQHNAPTSRLIHITKPTDLVALAALHFPVAVKAGERNVEYGRQFKKAYRVENAGEADDLVRRMLPVMPDVVVQEWIPGPDSNIYFCLQYIDRRGQVAASFTGRKLRSWPPAVGGTASCTAAPEVHANLSAITTQFFNSVGVAGIAGMEYKRDSRTGEFRMVEPTIGRTDFQEEVATLNGTNVPYAAYCSELGLSVPRAIPVGRPVVWRASSDDSRSAAAQNQRVADAWPRGSRVVEALWRWNDPVPLATQYVQRVLRHRFSVPAVGAQTSGSN